MSKQRRQGTGPEMALRRTLHAMGYRYRVAWPVPGKPRRTMDIAFPGKRVAVFVDGCFWHACPVHATEPRANHQWWVAKLAANRDRDRDTDRTLEDAGWTVVRLWEHETLQDSVSRVVAALNQR